MNLNIFLGVLNLALAVWNVENGAKAWIIAFNVAVGVLCLVFGIVTWKSKR